MFKKEEEAHKEGLFTEEALGAVDKNNCVID